MINENDLLDKIKQKALIEQIFDYINNSNFKAKFFLHSKKNQKKFQIKYLNYLKIKLHLDKYLYFYPESSKKDILDKEYYDILKNYELNKKTIENLIYDILKMKK